MNLKIGEQYVRDVVERERSSSLLAIRLQREVVGHGQLNAQLVLDKDLYCPTKAVQSTYHGTQHTAHSIRHTAHLVYINANNAIDVPVPLYAVE